MDAPVIGLIPTRVVPASIVVVAAVLTANTPAVVPDCADIFFVFLADVYVAYAASSAVCRRRRVTSLEFAERPFLSPRDDIYIYTRSGDYC